MSHKRQVRNLRRGTVEVPTWREPVDGRAPRLSSTEYIGTGVTRSGRFASKDPLRTGKVWSRWQWAAAAGWAGLVTGALAAAKRERDGA